jgi:hypothetical protein
MNTSLPPLLSGLRAKDLMNSVTCLPVQPRPATLRYNKAFLLEAAESELSFKTSPSASTLLFRSLSVGPPPDSRCPSTLPHQPRWGTSSSRRRTSRPGLSSTASSRACPADPRAYDRTTRTWLLVRSRQARVPFVLARRKGTVDKRKARLKSQQAGRCRARRSSLSSSPRPVRAWPRERTRTALVSLAGSATR